MAYRPRPYQLELLDAALEYNTIVLLGTGAGKTFIAVLLIKEFSHMILGSYIDDPSAKRTIFLVNTVPLVTQQANYIQSHTSLNVGIYYGEMGVDNWDRSKWNSELDKNNILVMTRQIFLDMLSHGFMELSRVNLLIFDECHHAVKNDPYVQIMKFYNRLSDLQRPHILGLSASIISGKCKPEKLYEKLKELEVTLCSRTETAKDLKEVAKYATNPDEIIRVYSMSHINSIVIELKKKLDQVLHFIQSSIKPGMKESVASKLATLLEECLDVLENVSTSSAIIAVELIKEQVTDIKDIRRSTPWDNKLCELTLLKLSDFSHKCSEFIQTEGEDYSPKFSELLQILAEFDSQLAPSLTTVSSNGGGKSCGIIFVEQRSTAICLSRLIQSLQDNLFCHIKCHFIVGHSASGRKTMDESMNAKKQQEILQKFRSGQLNLLVATSVVEEGLDVRKCNMVVRYDFPKTFQSHVQSKGRARAENSRYILLVDQEDLNAKKESLNCYLKIEKTLAELCHDREVPDEDEVERRLRHKIPPYQPFGTNGPCIAIEGSLSLLHRYCQKLPTDSYTILAPEFIVDELHNHDYTMDHSGGRPVYDHMYVVTVHLPMSSPVNEAKGRPYPRINLAKKSAALEAIKLLHQAGELNDHLKPVEHEDEDSDEEDEEKTGAKKIKHCGTHRKITYYKNQVASCLQGNYPVPGSHTNYLYVFSIQYKESGEYYQLKEDGYCTTLGLLTKNKLPYTKIPPFSLYIGHTEVTVSLTETSHTLESSSELELYETFHKVLFSDIIRIKGLQFSVETSERSYLIVPVTFAPKVPFAFVDQDIMKELIKFSTDNLVTPNWPFDWSDKLVVKNYSTEIDSRLQLYELLSFNPQETPLSPFPDNPSITYSEYFYNKYQYTFSNFNDPSLTCRPLSGGNNSLRLISSRFKSSVPTTNTRTSDIKLFPELCKIWPVSASFWKYCHCVPSIIKRIESLLLINELSDTISDSTTIGIGPTYEYSQYNELLTGKENEDNNDRSMFYWKSGEIVDSETSSQLERQVIVDCVLRKPSNSLLLQSMTACSANDSFELERLETLGDSFLKLSTTLSLFCARSNHHEGKLAHSRENRISNFNLSYLAKKKGLPFKMISQSFEPLSNWIPPCFTVPHHQIVTNSSARVESPCAVVNDMAVPGELPERIQSYYYHKTTDKGIADCMESLLGAYLVSGGIESGLVLMDWIGIKCPKTTGNDDNEVDMISCNGNSRAQSQCSMMSTDVPFLTIEDLAIKYPLLYQNSCQIFQTRYFPSSSLLREVEVDDIHKMIATCLPSHGRTSLCDRLSWTFNDPALLLEALTHPSYTKNRLTASYQRLEFLGDAVLDYLVTCCLYSEFPDYTPGQLTQARSVLVSNISFAEIAVKKLRLHTCLLHLAPGLFKLITEYASFVEPNNERKDHDEEQEEVYCQYKKNDTVDDDDVATLSIEECSDDDNDDDQVIELLEAPKVLADVLESVAGALFIDSGMSLETVWRRFYPFFKPMIDKFKADGPPLHPIQELLGMNPTVEISPAQQRRSKHRCTIKVIDKCIQVSCVASTYKAAKIGAAKRVIHKLKELI